MTMRIAYLVPEFPGQTHAFFWREIEQLQNLGVHARLISTTRPAKTLKSHSWAQEAERRTLYLGDPLQAGAGLFEPSFWKGLASAPRDAAALACAARLVRIARRESLTHVHVHSCGRAALIASMARRMSGLAYSLSLHGPLEDYGNRQPEKFKNADFALAITEELANSLRVKLNNDAPLRLSVCPMGVNTNTFARRGPLLKSDTVRLLTCGRLNYVKGHQDLIEAVSILRNRGCQVTLRIAGEDDDGGTGYRKRLEGLILKLGLGDAVTLLGAVAEQTILDEMEKASLFVLASHHEPLGVAIMEAMSFGLPVIATNAGGVPHLIEDNVTGYLVPPKDPSALADRIEKISLETTEAICAAARRKVVTRFDSQIGATTLERMLHTSHNPYHFDDVPDV